ncbi:DJ-1 family glyoxalase III [Adlercreutzia sp. ZJ154]|uniref:DJ-1 family glyoxalase III n=1 Tax=Adlercreutzia sp. ZJ154 TaxID=2709790 RepID=UPI0013EDF2A9|nr:DJ-1 family glyoxalase III [Adlercreutzia sp. ZJ154]
MKLAIMLGDGFEPIEAMCPTDVLRRGGVDVTLVSVMPTKHVIAAQGITVVVDAVVADTDLMEFDAICLPGGMGGVANLSKCDKLTAALPKFMDDGGRMVAAICAGPTILSSLGLLHGRKATCYPGCETDFPEGVYCGQDVCKDGNLITASGPAYALEFGVELLRALAGDAVASQVMEDMLIKG